MNLVGKTISEDKPFWAVIDNTERVLDTGLTAEDAMKPICNRMGIGGSIPWEQVFTAGFKLIRVRLHYNVVGQYVSEKS